MHRSFLLSLRIVKISAMEAGRNRVGILLFFLVPALFLNIVRITAGEGLMVINLYFPDDIVRVLLTAQQICLVFGTVGICGFLSAYYAMILFHQSFGYFRYWVLSGLPASVFLAGRFGFYALLIVGLGCATTMLTLLLTGLIHPGSVILGYIFLGLIYGCCGGIAGLLSRDPLVAFLLVVILADIDASWLQNPVYYTAGQNLDFIRWLPAFYPSQLVFAGAFSEDVNIQAVLGSAAYALIAFSLFLGVTVWKLGRARTAEKENISERSMSLEEQP